MQKGSIATEPFAFATVTKTILKLTAPIALPPVFTGTSSISRPVLNAMQQLVAIVDQLCSPAGGWPPDLEQTPQNLEAYVTEEAYEVISALQQDLEQQDLEAAVSSIVDSELAENSRLQIFRQFLQGCFTVEDLIPRLLWYIARSSYDLMQLVGGVNASLYQPDHSCQKGILRLATTLEVKTSELDWLWDLVTNQSPLAALSPDFLVKLEKVPPSTEPLQVGAFLQTLRQQIQTETPEITGFLHGLRTELLIPGKDWQSGLIQLHLSLVFVQNSLEEAGSSSFLNDSSLNDSSLSDSSLSDIEMQPEMGTLNSAAQPDHSSYGTETSIQTGIFTLEDKAIKSNLARNWLQKQLVGFLPELRAGAIVSTVEETSPELEHELEQLISRLVALAYQLVKAQTPITFYTLQQPQIALEDWIPKLLWELTRSSYEVMQWIGGIPAQVLQPEQSWQTGILRLVATITIQTQQIWKLDLATGQLLQASDSVLGGNVVVRSPQSDLCQEPLQINDLMQKLIEQLQNEAWMITTLMQGVTIKLREPAKTSQFGTMHLNLEFLLIPDLE